MSTELVRLAVTVELPIDTYTAELGESLSDLRYEVDDILENLGVKPVNVDVRLLG